MCSFYYTTQLYSHTVSAQVSFHNFFIDRVSLTASGNLGGLTFFPVLYIYIYIFVFYIHYFFIRAHQLVESHDLSIFKVVPEQQGSESHSLGAINNWRWSFAACEPVLHFSLFGVCGLWAQHLSEFCVHVRASCMLTDCGEIGMFTCTLFLLAWWKSHAFQFHLVLDTL